MFSQKWLYVFADDGQNISLKDQSLPILEVLNKTFRVKSLIISNKHRLANIKTYIIKSMAINKSFLHLEYKWPIIGYFYWFSNSFVSKHFSM